MAFLAIVVSVLVGGCGGAGGGGSDGGGGGSGEESVTFSGLLYDACSGDPIPGAQVRFGTTATESNAGGAFEIALDDSTATLSEPFSVLAEGYAFLLVDELDVDTSTAVSVALPLTRRAPDSYTDRRSITGQVYHDGDVEITAGQVAVTVYGTNGTAESFAPQTYDGGYAVETAVRSTDALVVVEVTGASVEGSPVPDFAYYQQGLDLSATGKTVDVLRPPAGDYDFATLSNADPGDVASAYWVTPYGGVPCHFDTIGEMDVAVYNPSGWSRLVLLRSRTDFSGAGKRFAAAGGETTLDPVLILPDLDLSLGPFEYAYDESLGFVDGVLSLSPAAGADLYVHRLKVAAVLVGTIVARSEEVSIPPSIGGAMAGETLTDYFRVLDIEPSTLRPDLLHPGAFLEGRTPPPSIRFGEAVNEGAPFSDELSVPEGGTIGIGLE